MFSHFPIDRLASIPVSFYGEERQQYNNYDDGLNGDEEMKQEVVQEVQQAVAAVQKEEIQLQTYNRFKE
jgi:hypothetical protein